MNGQDVTIGGQGSSFTGYLSSPASGSGPGVVVVQEIYGVNQVMRLICDWLSDAGYVALCPDLYWRLEPGLRLEDGIEEQRNKARSLQPRFQVEQGIEDLRTTVGFLRAVDGCNGRIGAVGFCLGGLLAYLLACRNEVDCSVGYYGVAIDEHLDESATLSTPLLLHVATEDQFVSAAAQAAMHRGLDGHAHITLVDYDGKGHAFARVGSQHFDAEAANAAHSQTLRFLQANLGR